jgi:hypothetical protein
MFVCAIADHSTRRPAPTPVSFEYQASIHTPDILHTYADIQVVLRNPCANKPCDRHTYICIWPFHVVVVKTNGMSPLEKNCDFS